MKPLITIILIISILGNFIGLILAYKYLNQKKFINSLLSRLSDKEKLISSIGQQFSKQILFIHHSVGSQWLDEGQLRAALIAKGIGVHDATYGDDIGENTDIADWLPKFAKDMDKLFKFDHHPNKYYNDSTENAVIMFKSCFPNSDIAGDGVAPGNPADKAKTLWNYKAVFTGLKDIFAQYPHKQFIYISAPPLVPLATTPENAARAREFNNWIKNEFEAKYKKETGLDNFLVFDFFDILADKNNYLKVEYRRNENDSHPNSAGTKAATKTYIEFLKANGLL